jgi:hypothetical protein
MADVTLTPRETVGPIRERSGFHKLRWERK